MKLKKKYYLKAKKQSKKRKEKAKHYSNE